MADSIPWRAREWGAKDCVKLSNLHSTGTFIVTGDGKALELSWTLEGRQELVLGRHARGSSARHSVTTTEFGYSSHSYCTLLRRVEKDSAIERHRKLRTLSCAQRHASPQNNKWAGEAPIQWAWRGAIG